ncbi:RING finger protein unkempt-like isoform X2 [Ornithodoros turicata]|uniref:RING finger protein unkempt-like isoform X2 n=1 Tax=Ornithodoros turicata TaxID=34597 RepID=UPI003138B46D
MPSTAEAKAPLALSNQPEKPNHYTYLKEFRVEQCPQFLQHKCTQHKPFTCFHWHFMNQRRRRPVRRARDGTFNYSPDVYCTKYDETSGICPEGDECQFLHRTAGDTERRYHLRYYKTGICVYDTDARGYCVKNGPHCAFAHGLNDLRGPVYDARELQACMDGDEASNGTLPPNSLDKERNVLNEDPRWQDTNYVLANYKTEPCKRPPRLCRQGYACPQYHNSRDKRRSPKKYKYRSTPCPNVKQGDEWGDPVNCDNGDGCSYCHTRTEQQFHPEIYKSTKCNDMQQTNYCPRGPFCAFAHVEKEISAVRDMGPDHSTNLAAILSNALPNHQGNDNGNQPLPTPIGRPRSYSSSTNQSSESLPMYPKAPGSEREDREASIRKQLKSLDDGESVEKSRQDPWMGTTPPMHLSSSASASFYHSTNTVESVVGNALDDLSLDDINVEASLDKELDSNPVTSSLTQGLTNSGLLGSSAPVNIPGGGGRRLSNLSPPLGSLTMPMAVEHPMDKTAMAFYGHSGSFSGKFQHGGFPPMYDFGLSSPSGGHHPWESHAKMSWEEGLVQARALCEAWKREAEDAHRREKMAEHQRDEALAQVAMLQKEIEAMASNRVIGSLRVQELEKLPPSQLRQMQEQLRSDMDAIEKLASSMERHTVRSSEGPYW